MPDDLFQLLKSFLAADKPDWTEPTDVLLMAHLIARADSEMKCSPSWAMLAECSRVHLTTVYRSALRLEKNDWIVKHSGARRQLGNTYVVQVGNLPKKDFTATIISDGARKLAYWYIGKVRSHTVYSKQFKKQISPRVTKGWEQRWAFVFQRWLDEGYPPEMIKAGAERAFLVDTKRAVRGAEALKQVWKQIMKAIEKEKAGTA